MKHLRLLLLTTCLAFSTGMLSSHEWKMWGTLQHPRAFGYVAPVSATAAIVIGGFPDFVYGSQNFGSRVTASCEILDVATGTVRYTDSTAVPHADGPMVRLSNGHVVILGGITDGNQGITTVVEEFDPITEHWQTLGHLLIPRRQQQAIALDDHRIMIVCGRDASLGGTKDVEIFDVVTGECHLAAQYPHDLTNHKLMMVDSVVYLIGGRESGPHSSRYTDAYHYNEVTDTWDFAFDLPVSMPLLEGIQIYGGMFTSGGSVNTADNKFSEVVYYINGTGATALPSKLGTPVKGHCFAPWVSDSIISFGGENDLAKSATASSWINTLTNEVTQGPELNIGRRYGMSVALQGDGVTPACVLAIAGVMSDSKVTPTVEILTSPVCTELSIATLLETSKAAAAGDARLTASNTVQLTQAKENSAGGIWSKKKVSLRSGMSTTFSFRLTQSKDAGAGAIGAEGIALVIQNATPKPVGLSGRGFGYEGIPNALAIEFDAYAPTHTEVASTHVAVQAQRDRKVQPWHRTGHHVGLTSSDAPLRADGTIYFARVEFHGTTLNVYVDDKPTFDTPVLSLRGAAIADMISLGLDGSVWVGITSASGDNQTDNEVLMWSIEGCNTLVSDVEEATNTNGSLDGIEIFPHPSSDEGFLRWTNATAAGVVKVSDLAGRVLWTSTASVDDFGTGILLPASDLASGMYIVQVLHGSHVRSVPWTIRR